MKTRPNGSRVQRPTERMQLPFVRHGSLLDPWRPRVVRVIPPLGTDKAAARAGMFFELLSARTPYCYQLRRDRDSSGVAAPADWLRHRVALPCTAPSQQNSSRNKRLKSITKDKTKISIDLKCVSLLFVYNYTFCVS